MQKGVAVPKYEITATTKLTWRFTIEAESEAEAIEHVENNFTEYCLHDNPSDEHDSVKAKAVQ